IAVVLFEFGFEAAEEREGVGGGAGESGHDLSAIEAPQFSGGGLENFRAESHLSIARHDDLVITADTQNGRGTNPLLHASEISVWHSLANLQIPSHEVTFPYHKTDILLRHRDK